VFGKGKERLTGFPRLLDVELIGDMEEVGVDESQGVGHVLFNTGAGIEDELDPALAVLCSDVVLDGSSDLALTKEVAVHELVEVALF
jgi:hypothetical protein